MAHISGFNTIGPSLGHYFLTEPAFPADFSKNSGLQFPFLWQPLHSWWFSFFSQLHVCFLLPEEPASFLHFPTTSFLRVEIRCSCVPHWALPSGVSPFLRSAKGWAVNGPANRKRHTTYYKWLLEKRMAELTEMVIYWGVLFERLFSLNALDCSYTIGLIFRRGRALIASLGVSRSCPSSVYRSGPGGAEQCCHCRWNLRIKHS